jgi:hypothetical protein
MALAGSSLLWIGLLSAGLRTIARYDNAPGHPGEPPAVWPAASRVEKSISRYALIVMAHPKCPCTRATLAELERLLVRVPDRVRTSVVFSEPGASEEEVRESELWRSAAAIPGVSVLYDPHGVETAKLGGRVSGHTVLYTSRGDLVFSGGLTSSRGLQGESTGTRAILNSIAEGRNVFVRTPVFGCSLRDPDAEELKNDPAWRQR